MNISDELRAALDWLMGPEAADLSLDQLRREVARRFGPGTAWQLEVLAWRIVLLWHPPGEEIR